MNCYASLRSIDFSHLSNASANFIYPPGTQVVVRSPARDAGGVERHARGALGVITRSPSDPWHSYSVRFHDGFECAFKREDFSTLKSFNDPSGSVAQSANEADLWQHVILKVVVGSRAYGLDHADSDTDYRGCFLTPASLHWSLFGLPEQIERDDTQETYWELRKFITLALKANPNVLEVLYSPLVEHATPFARKVLDHRSIFLSKLIYQTYSGYVASQFKKLEADLRNKGAPKPKHLMHLIRLLISGIGALRTGIVPVKVEEHRESLLAIRDGKMPLVEVEAWRQTLHREFEAALLDTALPERPDYAAANALLIEGRRLALREEEER